MEEKEVVELLQHYRHDVLNELQIIKGYLSIGKIDKVEAKLSEWIHKFNEERLLSNLNIPKWMIWVMQKHYANIRMSYTIDVLSSLNLSSIDEQLVDHSKKIITWLSEEGDKNNLYDINIKIKENNNLSEILISFYIQGFHDFQQASIEFNFPVRIEHTDHAFICEWSYSV